MQGGSGEGMERTPGWESALEPPNDGGAGYSGGGQGGKGFGNDGGEGGSDSSNGCCGELGGEGSGLDLSSIQQETFSLSPGAGGKKYMTAGGGGGGGGGGVLVDGEGPKDNYDSYKNNGQGYGGGGGANGAAGRGVVLMEIRAT